MTIVVAILFAILICFAFVVIVGAPYVPTLKKQIQSGLDLADLQPGETLLELGCGDGRVMLAAAARGWRVIGYELNPILVIICKIRTWRYRKHVRVVWGNFLTQRLPEAEAIFIFGIKPVMQKLDKKIMQSSSKPVKLVSFAFEVEGRQAVQQQDGLFLYVYK